MGTDTALKTLAGQPYGTLPPLLIAAGLACFGGVPPVRRPLPRLSRRRAATSAPTARVSPQAAGTASPVRT
jgi:hypothetical protein